MLKKIYYILIKLINCLLLKSNINNRLVNSLKIHSGIRTISIQEIKYRSVSSLEEIECKIFSQNGEDGIINYIIRSLNIPNPNFVEIGVGDYSEANTRYLYDTKNCKGLIIDVIEDFSKKVQKNVTLWKGDLTICEQRVETDNINQILDKYCRFDIDILSIDIDGIDYWILDCIQSKISKIIIAEYNSTFGPNLEITVPNIKNFDRTKYHYSNLCYGTSLKLLINKMKEKGYYFIGTNSLKNNAFFINEDFAKNTYFPMIKIHQLSYYTESNIRESRTATSKLNFLSGKNKLNEIKDCDVVSFENLNYSRVVKIKDLI